MRGLRGILLRSRVGLLHQSETWSATAARNCGPLPHISADDSSGLECPSLGQVKDRSFRTASLSESQLRWVPAAPAAPAVASAWGPRFSARPHTDSAHEHVHARRDVNRHHAYGEEWSDPYRCRCSHACSIYARRMPHEVITHAHVRAASFRPMDSTLRLLTPKNIGKQESSVYLPVNAWFRSDRHPWSIIGCNVSVSRWQELT